MNPDKIDFNSANYSMSVVMNNGWRVALGMDETGLKARLKEPSFDVEITDKRFEKQVREGLNPSDFCHILFEHFGVNRTQSIGLRERAEIEQQLEVLNLEHDNILNKIASQQKRLALLKKLASTSRKSSEFAKVIKNLKKAGKELKCFKLHCDENGYPHPPKPSLTKDDSKRGVFAGEKIPGIYFIYEKDVVIYVGKSIDVFSRTLSHLHGSNATFRGKSYSFLPFPAKDLLYIESFYIGVLRPRDNFGMLK